MFKGLGYRFKFEAIRSDEYFWFVAIDGAIADANKAKRAQEKLRGLKRGR